MRARTGVVPGARETKQGAYMDNAFTVAHRITRAVVARVGGDYVATFAAALRYVHRRLARLATIRPAALATRAATVQGLCAAPKAVTRFAGVEPFGAVLALAGFAVLALIAFVIGGRLVFDAVTVVREGWTLTPPSERTAVFATMATVASLATVAIGLHRESREDMGRLATMGRRSRPETEGGSNA